MNEAPKGGTTYPAANPNYPERLIGTRFDGTWRGEDYVAMLNRRDPRRRVSRESGT